MTLSTHRERLLEPAVLAAIGRLDLVARVVVEGFLNGLHHSPYRGVAQEFAEHRPYIAGDELRRIDWRVFARTDRLYVKDFDEETNAPVRLLLDVSASLAYAPRAISKLDYARYLCAALAYFSIRQNDRVSLTCFSSEQRKHVPASGGQAHLHKFLATLQDLKPAGETLLATSILREAAQWKRRGLVILISDLYDDPREVIGAVERLRRVGHDVIVFHLLDRAERELAHRGMIEFRDLETGETLLADADQIRRAYIKRVARTIELFEQEFARAGTDYIALDTSEPLDKALAIYLRSRKGRRGR